MQFWCEIEQNFTFFFLRPILCHFIDKKTASKEVFKSTFSVFPKFLFQIVLHDECYFSRLGLQLKKLHKTWNSKFR